MYYIEFLTAIHRRLAPKAYLEIGVRDGRSLALARSRAVGIDPAYAITHEIDNDVALFRTSSDAYFAQPEPLAATGGRPFEMAFIDGLHIFEFAFRDFINAERHSAPHGVIVFDDVLPRSVDEAARVKHTRAWTGDVYPIIEVLARYRPDLIVLPVSTQPTGLLMVIGLDPTNTVLTDHYDEIVGAFRHPDPQPVPTELLDRLSVVPPTRLLESELLEMLNASAGSDAATLSAQLHTLVGGTFGSGFVDADRVGLEPAR